MIITLKQLKKSGEIIAPQTIAEAVLVNEQNGIITLKTALDKKIENIITPAGSGLKSYVQDKNVILTHSNTITANNSPQPVLLQYDNCGHIVDTKPLGKLTIFVNKTSYAVLDGTEDKEINFGDDFYTDNNNIKLNWNNI